MPSFNHQPKCLINEICSIFLHEGKSLWSGFETFDKMANKVTPTTFYEISMRRISHIYDQLFVRVCVSGWYTYENL